MFEVYTDGSCNPNPGYGAYAYIVVENNVVVKEYVSACYEKTTNNRMEYQALIAYLETSKDQGETVYSDSMLLVETYNYFINNYFNSRKSKKLSKLKNVDLLMSLYSLKIKNPTVKVKWIKAHVGHIFNEHADKLANAGVYDRRNLIKKDIQVVESKQISMF